MDAGDEEHDVSILYSFKEKKNYGHFQRDKKSPAWRCFPKPSCRGGGSALSAPDSRETSSTSFAYANDFCFGAFYSFAGKATLSVRGQNLGSYVAGSWSRCMPFKVYVPFIFTRSCVSLKLANAHALLNYIIIKVL